MISLGDVILVGRANKTHGINGELSVSFFDEDVMDSLESGYCLIFLIDGIYVPFFVEDVRPRGAETLLISLEGETTKEEAAVFVGKDVYMRKSDVEDIVSDDEGDGLYAAQLIDYEVYAGDRKIGVITDIDDNPDNPLFVVKAGDNNILIPIVDDFITDIDPDARRIEFDLPEGLLDINAAAAND